MHIIEAGPNGDRYTVETPWTSEGVSLALADLREDLPWMDRAGLNASMLMLVTAPHFDGVKIDPMDGSGITTTGRYLRAALDNWTAFDRAEVDWENENLSCDVD